MTESGPGEQFNRDLPGVQTPHQKLGLGGGADGGYDDTPSRDLPPYERGPPLSYMERIAEKRQLEEVNIFYLYLILNSTLKR